MRRCDFIKATGRFALAASCTTIDTDEVLGTHSHLSRRYFKGRDGDAANVVLTAVGYNFRLLLAWLQILLRLVLTALSRRLAIPSMLKSAY